MVSLQKWSKYERNGIYNHTISFCGRTCLEIKGCQEKMKKVNKTMVKRASTLVQRTTEARNMATLGEMQFQQKHIFSCKISSFFFHHFSSNHFRTVELQRRNIFFHDLFSRASAKNLSSEEEDFNIEMRLIFFSFFAAVQLRGLGVLLDVIAAVVVCIRTYLWRMSLTYSFRKNVQIGPIYTWRRICRRIVDEYSTNTRRIVNEEKFFAGEEF